MTQPLTDQQLADDRAETRVVAYRSPGTRTMYCLTCARQETGWQPVTGAEVQEHTACDFCGGRVLAVASQTLGQVVARHIAAANPVCICGHSVILHHEDVCLRADCACADVLEVGALPEALEAVLTKRFTELGNQFAEMRVHEQGPDGWPSSRLVSPRMVADVLRELLAAVSVAAVSSATENEDQQ